MMHPLWKSTLRDVFKKVDMLMTRQLDPADLRIFGEMSGLKYMKKIQDYMMNDKQRLRFYSSSKDGLTMYGFTELCTDIEEIKEKDLDAALKQMGYDEDLFSNKTRNFVFSVHCNEPIKCSIGDALNNDFQQTAQNLLHDKQLK